MIERAMHVLSRELHRRVGPVTVPDLVTFCGGALGFSAIYAWQSRMSALLFCALMAASLACDCLDGWLARRLDAATEKGAMLDWGIDTGIAHATAWSIWPEQALPISVSIIAWQLLMLDYFRISGRSAIVVAAMIEVLLIHPP